MGIIKRQGIKNAVITYLGFLIGAFSTLYIQPEFLTLSEVGFIRNLYNLSFLFSLAIPLGLPSVILKFYPSFKENNKLKDYVLGFILIYFFFSCLLTVPVFYIFQNQVIQLYSKDSQLLVTYFFCVIPMSIIVGLNSCITYFSLATKKSTASSFLNDVFSRVAVIVCITLYHYNIISFNQFVAMYVVIYLIVTVILLGYLNQFGLISFKLKWQLYKTLKLKQMIQFGLYLCVVSFATFGLRSVDSVFLGFYSLDNVAIYTTAVFLAQFIEIPLGAIDRISQAKITEGFLKNDMPEISKIYNESVKYLLVIGGFIFLGINACSKYLLEFLPSEYSQAHTLVMVLSFGSLINISTGINNSIIFYSNYYKVGGLILFSIFITTIFLDILFIPTYGLLGAAIITATVSILFNFSKFLFIYKKFKFQPYSRKSLYAVLIIALNFVFVYFLPSFTTSPILNIFLNGSIVSVTYIFCIYQSRLIPELFEMVISKFKK